MLSKTTMPAPNPTLDELLAAWRGAARRVSSETPGSPAFDAAVEALAEARAAYDAALRGGRIHARSGRYR